MIALFAQQSNIVEFPGPQSKSNEWYTPSRYVEAAREVMGGIDLDPASCKKANETIKAAIYYTKEQNGLAQEWHGRVWLNPPYGYTNNKSNLSLFTYRLIREYRIGNVEQGILLSTVRTDTDWFFQLLDFPVCFSKKIYFEGKIPNPKTYNKKYSHFHGTIFVYLGKNEEKFIEVFSRLGDVVRRVSAPKVHPVNLSLWEVS